MARSRRRTPAPPVIGAGEAPPPTDGAAPGPSGREGTPAAPDRIDSGEQPTRLIDQMEREEVTREASRRTRPAAVSGELALGTGLIARHQPADGDAVAVLKVCPHCGTEYETEARFCPKDGASLRPIGGSDPLVGTTLADRYHMLKTVGEGGMGRVYLAEHVRMNRQCAVKVMRSALVHDADAAARFGREASSAARILHPNVAAVFDFGEADGLVYLVMEYVDGEPLGAVLAREQRLPAERAVDIARQVADGLAAAHDLGIVHRDLKPDNIIITKSRTGREIPKVVDFGIAKAVAEGPSETLTRSGFVIGTPEFMSPEQLLGDPVDARSDIYSLGCILYLMLLGVPAADAPTREAMLKRRLREAPAKPSELDPTLPPALDDVVMRMLATSPDDRFSSAAELRDALDTIMGVPRPVTAEGMTLGGGASGESASLAAPSGAPPARRPVGPLIAIGAGLLAIVAVLLLWQRDDGAQAAGEPTPAGATAAAVSGATTTAGLPLPAAADSAAARAPSPPSSTARPSSRPPERPAATPPARTESTPARPVDPARRRAVAAAERYASAIASRDMSRVQRAYPGISGQQREALQRMFDQSERISASVNAGSLRVDGPSASLAFTLRLTIVDRSSRDEVKSTLAYDAALADEGGRWVIRSLTPR